MPNNNNINGDKMILDVELTAKPITDEFWILTDGKNKVGNVCANNIGTFNVTLQNDVFEFETTEDIQKKTKINLSHQRKLNYQKQLLIQNILQLLELIIQCSMLNVDCMSLQRLKRVNASMPQGIL